MLNVTDIRNIKFSNSMNGYKKEEVEILLDKIEVDFGRYEKVIDERNAKISELENEIQNLRSSQNSIQNVLLSAQRLADQIVDEAKQKSEQIVKDAEQSISMISEREKQLTAVFEQKASERKAAFESEMEAAVNNATARRRIVEKAATDSVERQQMLFNKLRGEIASFKEEITKYYKQHLDLLSKLPDAVPIEPTEAAKIALTDFDKNRDPNSNQGNENSSYENESSELNNNEE